MPQEVGLRGSSAHEADLPQVGALGRWPPQSGYVFLNWQVPRHRANLVHLGESNTQCLSSEQVLRPKPQTIGSSYRIDVAEARATRAAVRATLMHTIVRKTSIREKCDVEGGDFPRKLRGFKEGFAVMGQMLYSCEPSSSISKIRHVSVRWTLYSHFRPEITPFMT